MIMLVIQFTVCMLATLSFAVLFNAPKSELIFCGLTGAFGWIVYLLYLEGGGSKTLANLIATLGLTLMARVISAVRRNPVTIYLISGIFPLVPGAGIYYTSYYFIMGETDLCVQHGVDTVKVAGAIVLGILFGFAIPQSWFNALGRLVHGKHDGKQIQEKE